MSSAKKIQSDHELRLRENYHAQRGLYLEMKDYRDEWMRRALKAEAELEELRETLLRLGGGEGIELRGGKG